MKIIVAGSTGLVATEVIRQALSNPAISSIVALARRVTDIPQNVNPDADTSKLKPVVCEDFENYTEGLKQELANADACIWSLAVTPSKASRMQPEESRKISLEFAVTGLKTISRLPRDSAKQPFRFMYISGSNAERDQNKKPWILGDYSLMRGEAENLLLEYAAQSKGSVEVCIPKPGLISTPSQSIFKTVGAAVLSTAIGLPTIRASEISAALLDQAVNGFEKDTLLNEDLVRIGQRHLKE